MVINLNGMDIHSTQVQNDGFMRLCARHVECTECELVDGEFHNIDENPTLCNTAQVNKKKK